MRKAIFAAVVAVHIALVWYFLMSRQVVEMEGADGPSMTLVFLPPAELDAPRQPVEQSTDARSGDRHSPKNKIPAAHAQTGELSDVVPNQPRNPPDWRTEAEIVTQSDAQRIIESENQAARQANALTALIKPLPGPRKPGPAFHWDPNPRYRWQPAEGGGFIMPINDHCAVVVLIMVWLGCAVGELPPARGDLFENMHPPVKYGDWDWRRDGP